MKNKKIFIILGIFITILFIFLIFSFVKYKNLIINVDIVQPGSAVVIEDPLKGKNITLTEGKNTTIDIQIKKFFKVKVYPIIENKNIIDIDMKNNKIIAKNSGETTVYFQNLFGLSKSNKIKITVIDKITEEYENDVNNTEKYNNVGILSNLNKKTLTIRPINNIKLGKANQISLENEVVDIDNFILNGRTYIDIYDYCEKINCSIEKKQNTLTISKEINDVNFIVTHEINTDTFETIIENGNQKLDYDIGSKNIDVKSCPNNGWKCDETNIYIPIRFLMQAFGYTVIWNQETQNISISNNLTSTFNDNYKIMVTDTLKNPNDIIQNNSQYQINKQRYLYVTDKNNKVMNYQLVLSFSNLDVPNGQNSDNTFEILGNNIKLLNKDSISDSKIKILVIQGIWDENNESSWGGYPIIIDFKIENNDIIDYSELGETQIGNTSEGYSSLYKVRGLEFKEYKQTLEPYKSLSYWNGNILNYGCGPVAVATICSAYSNETPQTVANYMNKNGYTSYSSLTKTLGYYGFNAEVIFYEQNNNEKKKKIQDHLLNGGTIIFSTCSPKICSSPSYDYANSSHIIAVLNIDPNNLDSIYVSNPNPSKKNGWQSLDYLLKHVNGSTAYFILVSR